MIFPVNGSTRASPPSAPTTAWPPPSCPNTAANIEPNGVHSPRRALSGAKTKNGWLDGGPLVPRGQTRNRIAARGDGRHFIRRPVDGALDHRLAGADTGHRIRTPHGVETVSQIGGRIGNAVLICHRRVRHTGHPALIIVSAN